ncbi:MAG: lysylphosphatidylglycerol synthase transmembrane domain-containing protein, partial [Candidatus Bathyarchaeia archaeon]
MLKVFEVVEVTSYASVFPLIFLSMVFYSSSWNSILGILSVGLGFRRTLSLTWISTFIDLLIPTESIVGEVARVYLASNHLKKDSGKIAASVLIHRLVSSSLNLFGLVVGSVFLLTRGLPYPVASAILLISLGTTGVMIMILVISFNEDLTLNAVQAFLKFSSLIFRGGMTERYKTFILTGLKSFHQGIKDLGYSRTAIVKPVSYAVLAWLSELFTLIIIFRSVGYECPFSLVLIAYTLMYAVQTIPIGIVGVLGITEVTMTAILTFLGIPANI